MVAVDEGTAGVGLLATIAVLAGAVLVVAANTGSVLLAAGRAQDGADAAALAAAHAHADGRPPLAAAARAASPHGATVERCACDRAPVEVEVAVRVAGPMARALGVRVVTAEARAGLVRR